MSEMKISNTLVNDTNTGEIAYARQLKDNAVNYAQYAKITAAIKERFHLDDKFQDKLNNFFLYHYDEFHRFLEDPGLDDSIIDSWKEIQDFLAGLPDDETMWLKNQLTRLDNRITAMDIPDGGAYDVSADHVDGEGNYAVYVDLSSALAAVPNEKQKPGMSIRFIQGTVQSSDHKYVNYRLTKDEWSIDTEDWAIAEEGVYVDNPEFVYVKTDNEDKILWAIKKDGDIYYGAGCPKQVKDYIEEKISSLSLDEYEDIVSFLSDYLGSDTTLKALIDGINAQIATKVDKVEGKSLIDAEFAEGVSQAENPEFIEVRLDAENKILWAIKANGDIYFGVGVPTQVKEYIQNKISELSLDEYEDIVAFLNGLEEGDKTLQTLLNEKVDKEEGKSLIDAEYAEGVRYIENPEFADVKLDKGGRILEATRVDGTKLLGAGVKIGGDVEIKGDATILGKVDIQGATYTLRENPEWIKVLTDAQDSIIAGVRKDGSVYIGQLDNIPVNVQKALDTLSNTDASLDERITALESIFHISDNQEYIQVTTDSVGKILQSRNPEGVNKEYVGIETPSLKVNDIEIADNVDAIDTMSVINDPEGRIKIYTDSKKRILSYRDSNGILHEEVGINTNHMVLSSNATQDIINALNTLGYSANNPIDWSDSEFVEIPTPTVCAVVNIEVDGQAEAKGSDIPTYIQFWDKAGNYFRKPIILNAQGSSSMSYHIKNQAIDFTDDSKIKFGNWIPCDSFHIKKYFIDVFRGQCIVGYWLTEQMYQTRPYGERRPWDYLNSFNDVDNSNGSFSKDYYTGALAHPDGFPVKVFFNGKNAGVYAFNLKKDRANYYCKKDKQKQIILDGILGSTFWTANGDLTQPGEDGGNIWHDFEVRNPKISKDINGNKYDGDNPTEPSNDYATTKAAIERLTTAITLVNLESTTEAKKAKFEEFFNIPFLIDYDLIGQVIHKYDGYRKNWIWITNDGNKWCPTSYDMDSIFGQHWNGASYVQSSITDILGNSNYLPTGSDLLKGLYQTEMRARYKELRDKGIFSVDNIIGLLEKWINSCGYNNLKEDIEEIVTSPYIENGSIVVDGEGKQVLIPNTPSYRDGTKEYVYTPTIGGWYNSILRVKNWLIQRLQTLDTYYSYTNN